jgi:hypothetical protein
MFYYVQNFHLLSFAAKVPEGMTRTLILWRSKNNLSHLLVLFH